MGQTNNLIRRDWQHFYKLINNSFTKKYNINELLYFEVHPELESTLKREKQIKNWSKIKKINLIKTINPEMKNINKDLFIKKIFYH